MTHLAHRLAISTPQARKAPLRDKPPEGGVPINTALFDKLSQLTTEEQRLLNGEPLLWEAYASDPSFLVESDRFIPSHQMITLRPHTRFAAFPMHRHDYVEMLYMLAGQTLHTMETGETVTLRANELLLINRNRAHRIDVCAREDVAVNFIVQPAFFDYALELIGSHNVLGQFLMDALRNAESSVPYIHFQIADVAPIQCLLESMIYPLMEPVAVNQRILRASMGLLFLHLLAYPQRMRLSETVCKSNRLVVAVLDEIRNHYQTVCFADFAKANRLSAAYVSQTVKKATGKSCTELLRERRVEKAKQLLRDTDQNILEICEAVGYSNSSYFYRLFSQKTGLSPGEYRKQNALNSGHQ
ncbi:MAG TPA: helix-turn-helix domain-containing protein [Candidatus Limiplasma sp.]|nr:helix-turn-helix domain-containing protein [Candidatus Limiplasma sp.]